MVEDAAVTFSATFGAEVAVVAVLFTYCSCNSAILPVACVGSGEYEVPPPPLPADTGAAIGIEPFPRPVTETCICPPVAPFDGLTYSSRTLIWKPCSAALALRVLTTCLEFLGFEIEKSIALPSGCLPPLFLWNLSLNDEK